METINGVLHSLNYLDFVGDLCQYHSCTIQQAETK